MKTRASVRQLADDGTKVKTIFQSVGEPSGDEHIAPVVERLVGMSQGLGVRGFGGALSKDAGAQLDVATSDLAAIGFSHLLTSIPTHLRLYREAKALFALGEIHLALLVDYPGFNLKLGRAARRLNVPVLFFVAPQIWAWGGWRVKAFKDSVDRVAAILPFEVEFFKKHGVDVTYVGHPSLDKKPPDKSSARRRLKLQDDDTVVAFFPGSRNSETKRHWPIFTKTFFRLKNDVPNLRLVVAMREGGPYSVNGIDVIMSERSDDVMAAADVAVCKSGTTTLNAALAAVPFVTVYKTDPYSYRIARSLAQVPHISLPNLLLGRSVVPELIQGEMTPETLVRQVTSLLENGEKRRVQVEAFEEIRSLLGPPGVAERVTDMALEMIS